ETVGSTTVLHDPNPVVHGLGGAAGAGRKVSRRHLEFRHRLGGAVAIRPMTGAAPGVIQDGAGIRRLPGRKDGKQRQSYDGNHENDSSGREPRRTTGPIAGSPA